MENVRPRTPPIVFDVTDSGWDWAMVSIVTMSMDNKCHLPSDFCQKHLPAPSTSSDGYPRPPRRELLLVLPERKLLDPDYRLEPIERTLKMGRTPTEYRVQTAILSLSLRSLFGSLEVCLR